MTFRKDGIQTQRTYQTVYGYKIHVQDIQGQKVTYSRLGSVSRSEGSLGRLSAMITAEVPNE